MGDVFTRRNEPTTSTVYHPGPDSSSTDYNSAAYEVYDINEVGLAVTRHKDPGSAEDEVLDAAAVWRTIKVPISLSLIQYLLAR